MEESKPSGGVAQDDQKGVHEFINLGDIEYVSPEKERTSWWGFLREANEVVHIWSDEDDAESATKGHNEGK